MIRRVIRGPIEPGYDGDLPETTEYLDEAEIITSEVTRTYGVPGEDADLTAYHAPVLDIDFSAALVPSTTPGKFHLYLDRLVPHDKYMALLDALADAGIIEPGYAAASKHRGYSAVRLPWVKKPLEDKELSDAEFFVSGAGV